MIIISRTDNNAQPLQEGECIKVQAPLLPKIDIKQEFFCPCDVETCEYRNKVFADVNDADEYKNDKSSFLLRKYVPADSILITLEKNGVQVATINDNTLGEYFNGFTAQPDYIGFIANWRLILTAYGSGIYQFVFDKTILGSNSIDKSIKYHLLPFSNENADKTTRLEWAQNGSIRNSIFDFTGLNWYQQIRFSGIFWNETPTLEVDNYVNQDYTIEQIQDKLNFEYSMDIDFIPKEIGDPIINDSILANEILITDYNLNNYKQYIKFNVQPTAIETAEEFQGYNRKKFIIKFTKKLDNHIKTNY